MQFVGPISFRKQDQRVERLIRLGHTTDAELYAAQFGEWPVKGINPQNLSGEPIYFKDFFESKANKLTAPMVMAYVDPDKNADRTIHINRLIVNPATPVVGLFASRMIFTRISALLAPLVGAGLLSTFGMVSMAITGAGMATSFRYAIANSFMKTWAISLADIVGEQQVYLHQQRGDFDMTSHGVFFKRAEEIATSQPFAIGPFDFTIPARALGEAAHVMDMATTMAPYKFFTQDQQLQARLHNILVRGYDAWGKLPENEAELFAALKDMGVRSPDVVGMPFIGKDAPELTEIFHKSQLNGLIVPPAAEMNIGLNAYRSKEVIEMFWKDYLPLLYGDLVTNKYGDPDGFAKMGYSDELLKTMGIPVPARPAPRASETLRGPQVFPVDPEPVRAPEVLRPAKAYPVPANDLPAAPEPAPLRKPQAFTPPAPQG